MQTPNPITVEVEFTNTGKTPAFNVEINMFIVHAGNTPMNIREYAKHPVEGTFKDTPILTLMPNGVMNSFAKTGKTDPLGIADVENGRKLLYVFGSFSYQDVFKGPRHTIRFCTSYKPTEKRFASDCEPSYDYAD